MQVANFSFTSAARKKAGWVSNHARAAPPRAIHTACGQGAPEPYVHMMAHRASNYHMLYFKQVVPIAYIHTARNFFLLEVPATTTIQLRTRRAGTLRFFAVFEVTVHDLRVIFALRTALLS